MSEAASKTQTKSAPEKLAMSRALGAAFLSHQVEQLEKSVASNQNQNNNQYNSSQSWRSRPQQTTNNTHNGSRGRHRADSSGTGANLRHGQNQNRRSRESRRSREENSVPVNLHEKDGDIIVADASLLIYALSYLRKWSRDGREEVIVVPLEALNTLDVLKKGNTITARLARNASRWLEQMVGSNERIKVQADDAFVTWEDLLKSRSADGEEKEKETDKEKTDVQPSTAPEWLRRILCCIAYELKSSSTTSETTPETTEAPSKELKILLALSTPPPGTSPALTPAVPYQPGSGPPAIVGGKFDRAAGSLLQAFASHFQIPTVHFPPDAPPPASHQPNRPHPAYPNKDSHRDRDRGDRPPIVEKPAATIAMEGAHVNTHGEKTGPALAGTEGKEVKVIRLLTRGTKLDP